MRRILILTVTLGLATASAPATTYYVSPSGNDTWNGLYATSQGGNNGPWQTPGRAANALFAGDTAYVRAGTYNVPQGSDRYITGMQPARSGTAGNPITFKGYPGERPKIVMNNTRGSDGGAIGAYMRDWIVFERFQAATLSYGYNDASYADTHNCVFRDIVCSGRADAIYGDNNWTGFRIDGNWDTLIENSLMTNYYGSDGGHNIGGFMDYYTWHMVFRNNEIRSCYGGIHTKGLTGHTNSFYRNLVHDTGTSAWYDQKFAAGDLRDNKVYENIFWNIASSGDVAAVAPWYTAPGELRVWNNTINNNCDWAITVPDPQNPPVVFECWNNIVYVPSPHSSRNSGPHGWAQLASPYYEDYNCVYAPHPYEPRNQFATFGYNAAVTRAVWQATTGLDAHTIELNPQFVNPAALDVHLQPASPCVHAGVNHDGRVNMGSYTGNPDMGAYPRGNDGTIIGLLPSGTPSVRITSPSSSGTYATSVSNVTLAGTAVDDVAVTLVSWTNGATGGSGTASGTASWSVSSIPLAGGANTIVVRGRDGEGNTGLDTITVTYTPAGSDTAAPYVAQQNPSAGATGVALDANITFHVLDSGAGVNQGSIVVRVNTQVVTATVSGTSADTVVFYNPPANFGGLETVAVSVVADDLATTPNHLSASWSFTTLNPVAPDTTAPGVSQQSPAPGATGVARNTAMRFHLTDAQTGVNHSTVALRVNGASVTPTFSGTLQDTEVLYDPPADFASLATVTVAVDASDVSGNAMATANWSFTTGADVIPPPPAPSNLVAYPATDVITVQFSPSTGPYVTGYYLYYRNGTAGYQRLNIGNVTAYVLTGLQAGTTYHLQVTAYDSADQESDPTAEISATTLGGTTDDDGTPVRSRGLVVRPNRAALSEVGGVVVSGEEGLEGVTVGVFSVSGSEVGPLVLDEEDGEAALADAGWSLSAFTPGVYILVAEGNGVRFQARLLVTP